MKQEKVDGRVGGGMRPKHGDERMGKDSLFPRHVVKADPYLYIPVGDVGLRE